MIWTVVNWTNRCEIQIDRTPLVCITDTCEITTGPRMDGVPMGSHGELISGEDYE